MLSLLHQESGSHRTRYDSPKTEIASLANGNTPNLGCRGTCPFIPPAVHQNHLEGLSKHTLLSPSPEVLSDSARLGQASRMCSSNGFSDDADAGGPGTAHFRNH